MDPVSRTIPSDRSWEDRFYKYVNPVKAVCSFTSLSDTGSETNPGLPSVDPQPFDGAATTAFQQADEAFALWRGLQHQAQRGR